MKEGVIMCLGIFQTLGSLSMHAHLSQSTQKHLIKFRQPHQSPWESECLTYWNLWSQEASDSSQPSKEARFGLTLLTQLARLNKCSCSLQKQVMIPQKSGLELATVISLSLFKVVHHLSFLVVNCRILHRDYEFQESLIIKFFLGRS